ncbi:hypothetical protein EV702DRAFT_1051978 [Suillus placidus]|uniref:Secreted protein n=1 Tax=Suillus placidus TaxID=48579 RepID=A0A9P6ZF67_9AGAM|nr:hypothetical protein EV702DRAFT_1051978 [Suillus placidus]
MTHSNLVTLILMHIVAKALMVLECKPDARDAVAWGTLQQRDSDPTSLYVIISWSMYTNTLRVSVHLNQKPCMFVIEETDIDSVWWKQIANVTRMHYFVTPPLRPSWMMSKTSTS